MKTALEVLEAARELIAKPGAWTQGAFARDADGDPVYSGGPSAISFCALGALNSAEKLYGTNRHDAGAALESALKEVFGQANDGVGAFNDASGRQHGEVLALFDAAIKREKEKQS